MIQIFEMMRNEPLASSLFIVITIFILLKITGVYDYLPNKILSMVHKSKATTDNTDSNKSKRT